MSPIYLYNGKILLRDNKIATNENCCCVLTPTPTPTPTPSPVSPGCDCFASTAVCSSVTWSMNNIYDNLGNALNITDTVTFAGLNHFYISPNPAACEVAISAQCNVVNKQLVLDLSVNMLFAPNGTVSYFCKPTANPGDGVFNGAGFTKQIVIQECDMNGFGDISGNYNMDQFGINCPNGDSTFQATWSISQPPCP